MNCNKESMRKAVECCVGLTWGHFSHRWSEGSTLKLRPPPKFLPHDNNLFASVVPTGGWNSIMSWGKKIIVVSGISDARILLPALFLLNFLPNGNSHPESAGVRTRETRPMRPRNSRARVPRVLGPETQRGVWCWAPAPWPASTACGLEGRPPPGIPSWQSVPVTSLTSSSPSTMPRCPEGPAPSPPQQGQWSREVPGRPVIKRGTLTVEAQFQSLVRELRSCRLCGAAKKKPQNSESVVSPSSSHS